MGFVSRPNIFYSPREVVTQQPMLITEQMFGGGERYVCITSAMRADYELGISLRPKRTEKKDTQRAHAHNNDAPPNPKLVRSSVQEI
jgi:hypothetical protein